MSQHQRFYSPPKCARSTRPAIVSPCSHSKKRYSDFQFYTQEILNVVASSWLNITEENHVKRSHGKNVTL